MTSPQTSVVGLKESAHPIAVDMIPSIPLAPRLTDTDAGNLAEVESIIDSFVGYRKNSPSRTGIELDRKSDIGKLFELDSASTSDIACII